MLETTQGPESPIEIASNTAICRDDRFAAMGATLVQLSEDDRAQHAVDLLRPFLADPAILSAAEKAVPETGYGRQNVFICPAECFTAVAVVWPAGIVSPIHDHISWCAFGVLEGEIEERRYSSVAGEETARAEVLSVHRHRPGDAGYLPSLQAIHSIHNPTDRAAVSIHIYGGDARKTGPNVDTVYTCEA